MYYFVTIIIANLAVDVERVDMILVENKSHKLPCGIHIDRLELTALQSCKQHTSMYEDDKALSLKGVCVSVQISMVMGTQNITLVPTNIMTMCHLITRVHNRKRFLVKFYESIIPK